MYTWKEWVFCCFLMKCSLCIWIKSIWSNVPFKVCVFLLVFCLDDVSIDASGVLELFLSFPSFMSVNMCLFVLRCSYVGCIHTYNCYIFFLGWYLGHYVVPFFVSCNSLYFKACFVWYEYWQSIFILIYICGDYRFPSHPFQSVCVSRFEVSLL